MQEITTTEAPGELSVEVAAAIPTMDLIVLRQLPVIEDRLREVKENIDKRVSDALSAAFDSGSIDVAKKIRAELNREAKEQDALRKAIKTKAMEPITQFEQTFKECSADAYKKADAQLKVYIDSGERAIKERCEDGLREYFTELCEANGVDFVQYEQAGVRVDMASARAKTPTKLRGQLEQFVIGVACDIRLISKMDDAEEIMVEYKHTLSVAKSVAAVQDRHRQIEVEKNAAEQRQAVQAQAQKAVERVQSFAPPVAAVREEKLCLTFSVTDTKPRLRLLKQFLDANGYKYE